MIFITERLCVAAELSELGQTSAHRSIDSMMHMTTSKRARCVAYMIMTIRVEIIALFNTGLVVYVLLTGLSLLAPCCRDSVWSARGTHKATGSPLHRTKELV